jgi:hypothetical protein
MIKEIIKVTILESNQAKEVNQIKKPIEPENPSHWNYRIEKEKWDKWQEAESKLRIFEIEIEKCNCDWTTCIKTYCYLFGAEPGTICEVEIVNEKVVKIIQ